MRHRNLIGVKDKGRRMKAEKDEKPKTKDKGLWSLVYRPSSKESISVNISQALSIVREVVGSL